MNTAERAYTTQMKPEKLYPVCKWCGQTTLTRYVVQTWPTLDDCGECATATKRPRGRPSTGQAILVRVPPHVIAVLDFVADAQGITRAELIRTTLGYRAHDAMLGRHRQGIADMLDAMLGAIVDETEDVRVE